MTSVLVFSDDAADGRSLAHDLAGQGARVLGCTECTQLVRDVVRLAPEVIVARVAQADEAFFAALALLAEAAPRPLLVFTADARPAAMAQALALGVDAWVVDGDAPSRLPALLALARARHEQAAALQRELQGLRARLDERKWIDRAKGLLMRDNALSEEQAFHLLRSASMHANLRVGEVSRGVIEAAQAADAINRAGQLRMLSQRQVKCCALAAIGIDPAAMQALAQQSRDRVDATLAHLQTLPLDGATTALQPPLAEAWAAMQAELDRRPPVLATLHALGEQLLDQADRLTTALERASGRHSLHIVNLCGRQRMLSQRIAALALLRQAGALPATQAGPAMAEAARDFELALAELERAPLSAEGIRAGLAAARGQWLRLGAGLQAPGTRAGAQALAQESEALLASFDDLTDRYEHSMQVLLA